MRVTSTSIFSKSALSLLLALTVLATSTAINLQGCKVVEHGEIVSFEIYSGDTGIVQVDFITSKLVYREVDYSDYETIKETTIQLSEADLAEYRTYVTTFSNRLFSQYHRFSNISGSTSQASDTEPELWMIYVVYDDGEYIRQSGGKDYPDDWETLVEKTKALFGFDIWK